MHVLRNAGQEGLSTTPDAITTGQNSGYQAVGLCVAAQPLRIVLLGYDMKFAPDGRAHWHKEHPVGVQTERWYSETFVRHFNRLAKLTPVPIVNATPDSALRCFPTMALQEALRLP